MSIILILIILAFFGAAAAFDVLGAILAVIILIGVYIGGFIFLCAAVLH